ncbi:MAG TPA: hypothetical protein VLL05_10095 [Terriglobales bacterium]|nr:hypothetical protein [Terriglobales bacterium]
MASPLLQVDPNRFPTVLEPKSASSLLRELSRKSPGITSASHLEIRPAPETASSGIGEIDGISGGLPRGCLTEVSGPDSSGRTSLMLSALSAATRREEICALIDASDAFDPNSAAAAGLDMERLLWIRCGSHAPHSALSRKRRTPSSLEEQERLRMEDPVEQALRAADLLLQSSGFGMVAIDLAGVPSKLARRIPLTTWFRFRRAVENTPTVLLVIGTEPCTQSCASLGLKLGGGYSSQFAIFNESSVGGDSRMQTRPAHAELLTGIDIRAEVVRARTERMPAQSAGTFSTQTAWTA